MPASTAALSTPQLAQWESFDAREAKAAGCHAFLSCTECPYDARETKAAGDGRPYAFAGRKVLAVP
jgi:hypothetical protein